MPWYLYLALNQLFPAGRRISFFSFMSIFGVAIGVFVFFISLAIMSGFQHQIFEKLSDTNADITLMTGRPISGWEDVIEQVEKDPDVFAANPYAAGVIMLVYRDQPYVPQVWSIDMTRDKQVVPIQEKNMIISGDFKSLDDESVFIGSGIARHLGISVGEYVNVYTPLMVLKADEGEMILPRELKVVGIFESGWGKVDSEVIIFSLRLMQELYGLDEANQVQGIDVRLKDGANVDEVMNRLTEKLGRPYHAVTMIEKESDFLKMLAMEKAMIFIITAVIVLVASFSISITMLSSVVSKTREIGLLNAMGARPMQIAFIYCIQAFILGTGGLIFGLSAAFLVLHNVDSIIYWIFDMMGTQNALLEFYMFHELPVYYSASDLVGITVATILLMILAALVPAWRAGRLKPSEALRYE
jgi:lipoprotein-releasing system permease protein